jgi:threonine/homoserine/homoserine lactone efflux protein
VTHYVSFLAFALALAVVPGPDMLLTIRTTVVGGRRRGLWTLLGICVANIVQGTLAGSGLGAVVAASQPVFQAIRWAGVAYLVYLGVRALRSALTKDDEEAETPEVTVGRRWGAVRQGFLCNITNPKVLAFNVAVLPQFVGPHAAWPQLMLYALTLTAVGVVVLFAVVLAAAAARRVLAFNVAVLPQFVGPHAGWPQLMLYALTLTAVGVVVLFAVVLAAGAARRLLASRRARRRIEGAAGVVFVGFAIGLAAEH